MKIGIEIEVELARDRDRHMERNMPSRDLKVEIRYGRNVPDFSLSDTRK